LVASIAQAYSARLPGCFSRVWLRASFRWTSPMASAAVAAAIAKQAADVRRMGAYVGFWEWLIYSAMRDRPVLMLFGSNIVHLHDFLPPPTPPPTGRSVRVAAVRLTDKGKILAETLPGTGGCNPKVDHYVIGKTSRPAGDSGGHVPEPTGGHGPETSGGHGPETSGGHGPVKTSNCAVRAALRAGWLLHKTQACGDCGIDVMAYHDRRLRVPASWRKIREELSVFMTVVKDDVGWQKCFAACQAAPPVGR